MVMSQPCIGREIRRCGKCARGHGTKDCVVLEDKIVCVNCRGTYVATDRKSSVREADGGGQSQSSAERSYAEAVKKVEEDGSGLKDPERIPVSCGSVSAQRDRPTSDTCFSKVGFLAFIAMVINYTAEMERKITENICCGGSCREEL